MKKCYSTKAQLRLLQVKVEVSKANYIFFEGCSGVSASEQSKLCIFLKDTSALCAREKLQMLQAQAVSKAQSVFLLKEVSAVLKREDPQVPHAQVKVSKADSVFLSQGFEHRRCKKRDRKRLT